jgi:hypothetical protein
MVQPGFCTSADPADCFNISLREAKLIAGNE